MASNTQSLTSGALGSDDPIGQGEENRGDSYDGTTAVKLADGGFIGDEEGTSVTTTISCID